MAAGLFASLFAASSTKAAIPSDARSDGTEQLPDDIMTDDVAPAHAVSTKEAQDVADVDMQLSSPPSSPPPPVSSTDHHAQSTSMELTASGSGKAVAAMERASSSTGKAGSGSTPTVQRASRRRTMPARLSAVSSLLAGSMLEEELLLLDAPASPSGSTFNYSSGNHADGTAKSASSAGKHAADTASTSPAPSAASFTASSVIVLTSDPRLLARAVFPYGPASTTAHVKSEPDEDAVGSLQPVPSSSSSLVSTLAIRRQQLIETPDFTPRDDTLYMPKTRGLRSDAAEDTSDAAYERRHRKPETAEKRQRKAEVDRLARDRLKLVARIEQLKAVEARLLQPVVVARDQVRGESGDEGKPLSERVEEVRRELLDDAYDTLKRYDLLLSLGEGKRSAGSPAPQGAASKDVAAPGDDQTQRSASPRLKIRIKGGRATWEPAESASPTPASAAATKSPSVTQENGARRVSARQPKQRVESLPVPLTAAKVEAVEDGRKRRRRRSGSQGDESGNDVSPRTARNAGSPEMRARGRSAEVWETYQATSKSDSSGTEMVRGRPQRAAAKAAVVAQKQQRRYAERSFSDYDDDEEEEEEDEEVESALRGAADVSMQLPRSSAKQQQQQRDQRSPSTSSVSSLASSVGYMYPTVADTGSLKVSPSLVEVQASDPATSSSPVVGATDGEAARKKLRLLLSSPSTAATAEIEEALHSDSEGERSPRGGAALTESEAESILAAFLGTTPLGKSTKLIPAATAAAAVAAVKEQASSAASASSARLPAKETSSATPSKRRSTRREATQSFGEKLPDVLTKPVPFDFTVMGYLRSIDRPTRDDARGR
ncbi:hypothetical protein EX895_003598 [Sporisorium graminicola]|uniref:Something about silencing protein 4 domain-containing protein n=1 Tax=Sporisorium graminicola TaxID=280036 RepID=A0A4U7KSV0_9BASI|nr:hypothetical protein EX895_003598 [Sporisorium graminicola]TKY87584.1 hypothetical protein EX895_003598 [Sporisorium graminicola]